MTERVDEILSTLQSLVRFDVRSLYDSNNSLLPVQLWPAEASLAVTGITSRELFAGSGENRVLVGVEHSVKLSDRTRALELALREAGLLHPDRRLAEMIDPAEMTDAELIRTVEYVTVDGHVASRWEAMSDTQVIEDYRRITEAFDRRCPGQRTPTPAPPTKPAGAQLALPAVGAGGGSWSGVALGAAFEEPVIDPPSITDWRSGRNQDPQADVWDAMIARAKEHPRHRQYDGGLSFVSNSEAEAKAAALRTERKARERSMRAEAVEVGRNRNRAPPR